MHIINDPVCDMRTATPIELNEIERRRLIKIAQSGATEVRLARRVSIVLLCADGLDNQTVGEVLGVDRIQVGRWRERYAAGGLDAIARDRPRGGRTPLVDRAEIVRLTTQSLPEAATQWSTRSLAAIVGCSDSTIQRVWKSHGLKPHRVRHFKVSRDPKFIEKLDDIVGLYVSPPAHALVLCCDEKTQVQALDRTQPGLPMKKGRAATMTHDYKRHGTTTLFAAISTLDGQIIAQCQPRHRHGEWLKFLKQIDGETPPGKALHLICDSYGTHKHPVVQAWLVKHPRFTMHFTPTSASWLNMVERFFRDITDKRLRRGVFTSVPQLVAAIGDYIAHHNANPKPLIWTKSAPDILEKVIRANQHLSRNQNEALHQHCKVRNKY
jgi:transposase